MDGLIIRSLFHDSEELAGPFRKAAICFSTLDGGRPECFSFPALLGWKSRLRDLQIQTHPFAVDQHVTRIDQLLSGAIELRILQ